MNLATTKNELLSLLLQFDENSATTTPAVQSEILLLLMKSSHWDSDRYLCLSTEFLFDFGGNLLY